MGLGARLPGVAAAWRRRQVERRVMFLALTVVMSLSASALHGAGGLAGHRVARSLLTSSEDYEVRPSVGRQTRWLLTWT